MLAKIALGAAAALAAAVTLAPLPAAACGFGLFGWTGASYAYAPGYATYGYAAPAYGTYAYADQGYGGYGYPDQAYGTYAYAAPAYQTYAYARPMAVQTYAVAPMRTYAVVGQPPCNCGY